MKIKNMVKASFFVLSISILVFACQWTTIEPVVIDDPDGADPVSFAAELQPVFNSKCVACHTSKNPVLTEGKAYNSLISGGYVNTMDPPSSIIVVQTNTGHGGMTPTEKSKLLTWIEQGALNN